MPSLVGYSASIMPHLSAVKIIVVVLFSAREARDRTHNCSGRVKPYSLKLNYSELLLLNYVVKHVSLPYTSVFSRFDLISSSQYSVRCQK